MIVCIGALSSWSKGVQLVTPDAVDATRSDALQKTGMTWCRQHVNDVNELKGGSKFPRFSMNPKENSPKNAGASSLERSFKNGFHPSRRC